MTEMVLTQREILLDLYQRLLHHFGPQHWWPAETPFEVIVGAILTQSAAWKNVEKAIQNLKRAGVLTPEGLRRITISELSNLIRPSGYYNAKAIKIKAFVEWLHERYEDNLQKLFSLDVAELRKELLSVHGIGEETADSIILYAAGKPVFVVDTYTRRIMSRIGLVEPDGEYCTYQQFFMNNLPEDPSIFNEYHALLVALGKTFCKRKPECQRCCLYSVCEYGRSNLT